MSLPAFSFPFAHWTPRASSVTTASDVIISRFVGNHLLLGLSSGEIAVFAVDDDKNVPCLQARLLGHRAPIMALEYLETVSETSAAEPLYLSLSSDGALSKWSLADNRCLQSMSSTTSESTKPQGLVIIPRSGVGEGRLTDSLVLVYGCNTEIVILNAESLETVFVWSGHIDWPIPVAVERKSGNADRECQLLTASPNGGVQSWVLTGKREKKSASVLAIRREEGKMWSFERREEWGRVIGCQKLVGGYLIVQGKGVAFHVADAAQRNGFLRKSEVEVKEGVSGVEIGTARKTVIIKTDIGNAMIYVLKGGILEKIVVSSLPGFMENDKIMNVAAFFNATLEKGKLAISSRPTVQTRANNLPGLDISVADIALKGGNLDIFNWNEKALMKSLEHGEAHPDAPSTCSEIFSNMLAIAHGTTVHLYSTSSFLLSYYEPTASIHLQRETSPICLLKRLRIGEYVGAGRGVSIYGGKEYLVAGTQSGDLFIIESPSYHCSKRLPVFPSAVTSAHLLPSNLGRRLRSTLLVSSLDGTASIIDIERARVMVTFPRHGYSSLESFATIESRDVIALTYQDEERREWSMEEEDGGILLNPPPSRGSTISHEGNNDNEILGGSYGEWGIVNLLSSGSDDESRGDWGEDYDGDSSLQLWDGFCRIGLPTAGVNVRAILTELDAATKIAMQRTRPTERRVVGNHPAIINAKSLLTALNPGGSMELFLDGEDDDDEAEWDDEDEGVGEWRFAVDQFFFRQKRLAAIGQIGAGSRVTMLTADVMYKGDISPTVTSIKLLAVVVLVSALLEATGKREMIDVVVKKIVRSHIGKRKVALGVFAKFWSDVNPVIRWVARECLDIFMSTLKDDDRAAVVKFWGEYLPVHVPPELSSAKEVSRSVILLGKLITDYDHGYDDSLKKSVAKSAELLLNENNSLYQDTAIEVIGYSWSSFENLFDAYEVIHGLIRISATELPKARRSTLHRCILEIAAKNSPLLASSLASNISHGTPATSPPTASLAAPALQCLANISTAAMRIVTHIIRADAMLFCGVLSILVDSVVKILDPNGGLRDKVLPTVTELVDTMVDAYPTLAFHRPTQRLALSAAPGIIAVYDLKSCTTAHILDGHHHLATFLSFSTDGRHAAAVDLDEDLLLVWRFLSGILSFIGTATAGDGNTLAPKLKKSFANSSKVGLVNIVWTGDRSLKVIAGNEESSFSV